jgi:predicted RND superfamily exporter protein
VQSEDFPLLGFINDNFSALSLFINATPMSNQELIDLDERITERFNQQFPESTLIHGSGLLLFARMDELVTIELLQGYSISLLLITLTLIIGLRSIHYGILSVLPNLLPATMVFGIWALLVGQLDPFVMMLFSISIGLVVDDTVHILSHYLDSRQTGMNTQESINFAINTAGPALTITTLVLALGTTILIGASTLYFQQAAKLLVPIVVLALVLDLLYLPTILKRFDKRLAPQNTVTP